MTDPEFTDFKLVLVPGWSFTGEMWQGLIEDLAHQGVPSDQIVTVDWLAMGRWLFDDNACPVPPEFLSGAVCWLGWSLGAHLVLEAMAQQKITPAQAIMVSASPRFLADTAAAPIWPGVPLARMRALKQQVQRDPVTALAQFDRWLNLPSCPHRNTNAADLILGLDWLAAIDRRAWLAQAITPIDWLVGGCDPLLPPTQDGASWLARWQVSSVVNGRTLADAGHDLPWSHRAALVKLLMDFATETMSQKFK